MTTPAVTTPLNDEDKLLIQRAYRSLLHAITTPLLDEDTRNIRKAYEMAVVAHSSQRRKSGEPYILHPIAVAKICAAEIGLGPTAIIAALLHDVVEDTEITLEEIRNEFGDTIGMIVDGLTKLDGAYDTESPQAENFRKVLSTLVKDVRVVLIKMADRLHNMRTLGSMPRHRQLAIAAETTYIYAPLAHRLGLYNLKTEFQDLSMKITDPETFHEIASKLQQTKRDRTEYIESFVAPLREKLDQNGLPYRIIGRPKSIYSIWNKIKIKKVPFEEIYDLFAIRIILNVDRKKEKAACWQVYSDVTDTYKPIPERLKDWITTPKSNGYESLHTSVIGPGGRFVEVQIRTERMDEIAERGYAAHWKYKGIDNSPDVYELWLENVREILDNKDADAIEFLNDFKTNLFAEEIYVYTPNGDVRILPKGATALDFAYSIHSDVGDRCASVKVNNKLVPMGTKLENGDQIHVITNKNQKPNEAWLRMVITGKARSKIRVALKEEHKKLASLGKEALERKLGHLKVDLELNVDMLVQYFGYRNRVDFYHAIQQEVVNLQELSAFKIEGRKLIEPVEAPEVQPPPIIESTPPPTNTKSGLPRIFIDGQPADDLKYSFSTCCKPVMGDDVFAYLTTGSGIKIHRTQCPNAMHLMANYGFRIKKAEWQNTGNSSFVADLLITGIDTGPGVIERISQRISTELGLDIRSFYIDGKEGYFEGKVSIVIPNTHQLNIAINSLRSIPGVASVVRAEMGG